MVKLNFENTHEFETLFQNKSIEVTKAIALGIEQAMQSNKKTAMLFEITFKSAERMFEISLPRSQWVQALESCLQHFHDLRMSDEAIDCWKLLEAAKVW
tara:strand:+ start:255 stop:551 length:297 start_codon:yes stop_codon:yes gene_type:complete